MSEAERFVMHVSPLRCDSYMVIYGHLWSFGIMAEHAIRFPIPTGVNFGSRTSLFAVARSLRLARISTESGFEISSWNSNGLDMLPEILPLVAWRGIVEGKEEPMTGIFSGAPRSRVSCGGAAGWKSSAMTAAPEKMEMKVSTKKDLGFFLRAARVFLQGAEAKEGLPARAPVDELQVSGLGEAIKVAVTLCGRLEAEGLAVIDAVGSLDQLVYLRRFFPTIPRLSTAFGPGATPLFSERSLAMPPRGKAKAKAAAGSAVDAARTLRPEAAKPKVEKFYREVDGIPWNVKLGVPLRCEARGCEINDCSERGVTLEQLTELAAYVQEVGQASLLTGRDGATVASDAVNLYVINDLLVKPLTFPFKCSWVELVAPAPQLPRWFVSHWICTFANNQHDLSGLSGQLRDTPFVKAILSPRCEGTVALLDSNVTTFDRIWCVLENFVSTVWAREDREETHFYDIACWLPENSALHGGKPVPAKPTLRMDSGEGESVADEATGGAFPLRVAVKGVTVDISKAKASREDDKRKILHLIAGTPEEDWSQPPPSECEAFSSMNSGVRRMFAAGALYKAALHSEISDLTKLLAEFPEAKDEGISDGAGPDQSIKHLHIYCKGKNNVEALKLLLEAGVQVDKAKRDGATAVFIATQFGSADALSLGVPSNCPVPRKLLLAADANPNLARQEDGVAPAYMAVQNGHMKELTMLLEARADLNQLTTKGALVGAAPLHLAVQMEKVDAVKLLLQYKADPNLETEQGNRPLSLVKNSQLRKLLVDAGAAAAEVAEVAEVAPKAKAKGKAKAKAKANFATASSSVTQQIGLMSAYELLEN
eukprot:s338_g19.t1